VWGILHSLPAAWPQYFTIRGNSAMGFYLMMYPAPAAAGSLVVYYYRQANVVTATQDIDTMQGWEDVVYHYAVWKAWRKAKRPEWQEDMAIYEAKLQQMIDSTRTMTDLGSQVTTGTPNWPAYAYNTGGDAW
jgi:hypothetical protein